MSAKGIERLARVLFESEPPHKDCRQEVLDGAWSSTDCDFKTSRIASVRAVLAALREPTEGQLLVAHNSQKRPEIEFRSLPVFVNRDTWRAMIDHLLAD